MSQYLVGIIDIYSPYFLIYVFFFVFLYLLKWAGTINRALKSRVFYMDAPKKLF